MRDPGGKRDTIKAEAMRLCVARGVDAVSVRDIAAACAMKPSNLYAHFASRDALLRELFRDGYAAGTATSSPKSRRRHPIRSTRAARPDGARPCAACTTGTRCASASCC